ncbi:unnamed protein product [Clonostachys rhizophaga]|uniref:Uncharacterized protein n=1 Tax=Clonostachys rhizophaga TaxID=160324 RepID=A0A9N9VMJ9_9HYPO|nr:unnamed protein product [Clonostachys rhizophaga]
MDSMGYLSFPILSIPISSGRHVGLSSDCFRDGFVALSGAAATKWGSLRGLAELSPPIMHCGFEITWRRKKTNIICRAPSAALAQVA